MNAKRRQNAAIEKRRKQVREAARRFRERQRALEHARRETRMLEELTL
jgi:hypothetical protein